MKRVQLETAQSLQSEHTMLLCMAGMCEEFRFQNGGNYEISTESIVSMFTCVILIRSRQEVALLKL